MVSVISLMLAWYLKLFIAISTGRAVPRWFLIPVYQLDDGLGALAQTQQLKNVLEKSKVNKIFVCNCKVQQV